MSGTRPSVSVIDLPFRHLRKGDDGVGYDCGWIGYRVIRNGLVGDQKQGGVNPT
jgi:hypothetical protein